MTREELKHHIDLTTLSIDDTKTKVKELTHKGIHNNVAAICVYPNFISLVKQELENTDIKVASVAGCFPSAQSGLNIILEEIKYAVSEGTDEIDIVFPVGLLLEDDIKRVYKHLEAIRQVTEGKLLKCILETGALKDNNIIMKASQIAIECGADFLKTSTGKISPAATPEASIVMLKAIKEHYEKTDKMVGFKAAGGISTYEEASIYTKLVSNILNKKWLTPNLFRIGASRLIDNL